MKLFLLSFIILLAGTFAYSQDGSKSKPILDKVASVNSGYKTIKADFTLTTTTSVPKDQPHTESGKILIKGDKYHLFLSNSDIIFDGKSIYTYAKEANEINITKPEPSKADNGDFFFSNPKDVFKGYNKNFKSTLIKETSINNVPCYEIDLYPINLRTKYIRIRLHVNKSTYQIISMKLFLKDGNQHLLEFTNFSPNLNLDDKDFIFDSKKYPNAEVNDMRF
jgi:outer membrane lipoprotein-sorting protein